MLDALRAELPDVEVIHEQGCASRATDRSGLRGRGRRGRATPTSAWPSSATSPACSDSAPRARAATRRTSGCPGCRRTCSRSCSPPARRWSWSSSPAVRTRSATCTAGPPARPGVHARARRAAAAIAGVLSGRIQPGGKLPVQIPRHAGRPAGHLPPAPLGAPEHTASATSTRRRCSRSVTARRTPPSRSTTCG